MMQTLVIIWHFVFCDISSGHLLFGEVPFG